MGSKLRKAERKLRQRKEAFGKLKNDVRSKRGNTAFKEPGSMNLHKQKG